MFTQYFFFLAHTEHFEKLDYFQTKLLILNWKKHNRFHSWRMVFVNSVREFQIRSLFQNAQNMFFSLAKIITTLKYIPSDVKRPAAEKYDLENRLFTELRES